MELHYMEELSGMREKTMKNNKSKNDSDVHPMPSPVMVVLPEEDGFDLYLKMTKSTYEHVTEWDI